MCFDQGEDVPFFFLFCHPPVVLFPRLTHPLTSLFTHTKTTARSSAVVVVGAVVASAAAALGLAEAAAGSVGEAWAAVVVRLSPFFPFLPLLPLRIICHIANSSLPPSLPSSFSQLTVPPVTPRRADTRPAASTARARAWEEPAGMGALPARGQAG